MLDGRVLTMTVTMDNFVITVSTSSVVPLLALSESVVDEALVPLSWQRRMIACDDGRLTMETCCRARLRNAA